MNPMIFPFSMKSDTIASLGVTPTKGKMFSCRSHFHPTTSLTSSLNVSVSSHFNVDKLDHAPCASFEALPFRW